MTSRVFTADLANRMLPLVRRIVEDIMRYHARWLEMLAKFDTLHAANDLESRSQAESLQEEIQRTAADIDRFIAELNALGVQFKGFEQGLVDFPCEMDGAPALLCWQLGEPAVEHWHWIDAGYAGRRRLGAG